MKIIENLKIPPDNNENNENHRMSHEKYEIMKNQEFHVRINQISKS